MSDAQRWIAIDWGTTNMRGWVMSGQDVVASVDGGAGMNTLAPEGFEPELLRHTAPYLARAGTTPVVICGMAGARQGWQETPYISVPVEPFDPARAVRVKTHDDRLDVRILPGLSQQSPPDVMRGEETEIAGYLAGDPDFDGILCLPGTHTKWVHISAREVVSFRTAMTGELFDLLGHQSVLRHSVAGDGWDEPAFLAAIDEAMSRPAGVAAELFGIRANDLLTETDAKVARARLSGLLIGAELAAMRPYWLGQRVVLVGAPTLAGRYHAALGAQGAMAEMAPTRDLALNGLIAAYRKMGESP